jgi:hypothetical protein
VVRAALRPRREVWIGWSTVKAIVGQRLIPGLLDRYASSHAWGAQTTEKQLPPGHRRDHDRDNLDAPLALELGAHGPFDRRARVSSTQQWAREHAGLLVFAGAALALALLWPARPREARPRRERAQHA